MTNNLPSLLPNSSDFQILQTVARNAASSGLYTGVGSEQKILMILLAAQELGVKPMMALNGGIWNIQGKIEISARLMNSMIRKAGHSIVMKQCDAKACILEGKRADNGDTFTASFTLEDAAKAGLSNRDVWKKYAEDMLYNRAMSRLARRLFPDVIGTAYVEGEIRDAKCEIIESVKEEESPLAVEQIDTEEDKKKLSDFVLQYPAENPETLESFFTKYSAYWNKSISRSIEDYRDHDKFMNDLEKFKKKQNK